MVSEQTLLNAGPLLVRASEDAAAAGYIFNVLMLARAPLVVFQAVQTSLLPHLTRLRSGATDADADAFRLSIRFTLGAIAVFAAVVALVVLVAGPALMQVAFGDKFSYDRAGLLLVTVGMGFYLSSGALNQAALARGQARRSAACWVTAALAFLIWNLLPILDEFRRVEVGFLGSAALLCGLLYLLYRSSRVRVEDVMAPGLTRGDRGHGGGRRRGELKKTPPPPPLRVRGRHPPLASGVGGLVACPAAPRLTGPGGVAMRW